MSFKAPITNKIPSNLDRKHTEYKLNRQNTRDKTLDQKLKSDTIIKSTVNNNEPDIGSLIVHFMRQFQNELYTNLREYGFTDITPRHGAIFAYLDPKGTRASVLSTRSGLHKQIIGNLIDELENLGYVYRSPDPTDRRAKLVHPTKKGLAQRAASQEIRESIEARYRNTLGSPNYNKFIATLVMLTTTIDNAYLPNTKPNLRHEVNPTCDK